MVGGRKRAKKKELPKRSRGRSKFEKALRKQIKGGRDDKSSSSSSSSSEVAEESSSSPVSIKRSRRGELSDCDSSDLAVSLSSQLTVGGAGSQPTPSTSAQPPIGADGGVGRRPAPSRATTAAASSSSLRPLPDLPSSGPSRPGLSGGTSLVDLRLQVDSMDSFSPNDDFHDDGLMSDRIGSNDSLDRNNINDDNNRSGSRESAPSSSSSSSSIPPRSDSQSGSAGSSNHGSHDEVDFGEDDFDEERIADLMREFRCLSL